MRFYIRYSGNSEKQFKGMSGRSLRKRIEILGENKMEIEK